ncbi:MAG: MBL fold metallo-hydrolase [bacterium (Candidatus Stahlbacteria) CG08_land_8_20_14_0_20_40_26]|nr:MAG: MBL fold metallo-hydrolase [bacterium (Candidatus Stahlbacteria) CG08_land_8_20_14_0_20_40_26]
MKVTIIYDNTAFRKDLQSNWGFSALVEARDTPRILFDTGSNGKILLSNLEKLEIDPNLIDEVFISHPHFDHVGGLSDFLKVNPKISKIYVPSSLGLKNEVILKEPQKIHENVFSTGELEGIEQSMGIKTDKGIVLMVGCSHPYMGNILDAAKQFGEIYAVIGGMHGFSEFELFRDLKLICPTHCTQYKTELKKLYPQKYVEGGAGRIIEI